VELSLKRELQMCVHYHKNKNIKNVQYTTPPYISWVELCTELFYAIIRMLFADLLSLHVVTFLMFFVLVHVFFLAVDACLS